MAWKGGRLIRPAYADLAGIAGLVAKQKAAARAATKPEFLRDRKEYTKLFENLDEAQGMILLDNTDKAYRAQLNAVRELTYGIVQDQEAGKITLTEGIEKIAALNDQVKYIIGGRDEHEAKRDAAIEGVQNGTVSRITLEGFNIPTNKAYNTQFPGQVAPQTITGITIDDKTGTFNYNVVTGIFGIDGQGNQVPVIGDDENSNPILKSDVKGTHYIINKDFLSRSAEEVAEDLNSKVYDISGSQLRFGDMFLFEAGPPGSNIVRATPKVLNDEDGNRVMQAESLKDEFYNINVDPNGSKTPKEMAQTAKELRDVFGDLGRVADGFIGNDGSLVPLNELQYISEDYLLKKIPLKRILTYTLDELPDIPLEPKVDLNEEVKDWASVIARNIETVSELEEVNILNEKSNLAQYVNVTNPAENQSIIDAIELKIQGFDLKDKIEIAYDDLDMRGYYYSDRGSVLGRYTDEKLARTWKGKLVEYDDEGNVVEVPFEKKDLIFPDKLGGSGYPAELTERQEKIVDAYIRYKLTTATGQKVDYYYKTISDAEATKSDLANSSMIGNVPGFNVLSEIDKQYGRSSGTIISYDRNGNPINYPRNNPYAIQRNQWRNVNQKEIFELPLNSDFQKEMKNVLPEMKTANGEELKAVTGIVGARIGGRYVFAAQGPVVFGDVEATYEGQQSTSGATSIKRTSQIGMQGLSNNLSTAQIKQAYDALMKNNQVKALVDSGTVQTKTVTGKAKPIPAILYEIIQKLK
jgi:hypothetical protein